MQIRVVQDLSQAFPLPPHDWTSKQASILQTLFSDLAKNMLSQQANLDHFFVKTPVRIPLLGGEFGPVLDFLLDSGIISCFSKGEGKIIVKSKKFGELIQFQNQSFQQSACPEHSSLQFALFSKVAISQQINSVCCNFFSNCPIDDLLYYGTSALINFSIGLSYLRQGVSPTLQSVIANMGDLPESSLTQIRQQARRLFEGQNFKLRVKIGEEKEEIDLDPGLKFIILENEMSEEERLRVTDFLESRRRILSQTLPKEEDHRWSDVYKQLTEIALKAKVGFQFEYKAQQETQVVEQSVQALRLNDIPSYSALVKSLEEADQVLFPMAQSLRGLYKDLSSRVICLRRLFFGKYFVGLVKGGKGIQLIQKLKSLTKRQGEWIWLSSSSRGAAIIKEQNQEWQEQGW